MVLACSVIESSLVPVSFQSISLYIVLNCTSVFMSLVFQRCTLRKINILFDRKCRNLAIVPCHKKKKGKKGGGGIHRQ